MPFWILAFLKKLLIIYIIRYIIIYKCVKNALVNDNINRVGYV